MSVLCCAASLRSRFHVTMGCDLVTYRLRIGLFRQRHGNVGVSGSDMYQQTCRAIFIVICISLLVGNIEPHPGPSTKGDSDKQLNDITKHLGEISKQLEVLAPMKQDVSHIKAEMQNMNTAITDLKKSQADLNDEIQLLKADNIKLKDEVCALKARQVDGEDRMRRNNLLIYGIPEAEGEGAESWSDCESRVCRRLKDTVKVTVNPQDITRCHRLNINISPRPIICGFSNYKRKEEVLQNRKNLKDSDISIQEDFSRETRATRQKLIPYMLEARKDGKRAYLNYTKLRIEGDVFIYVEEEDKVINIKTRKTLNPPAQTSTNKSRTGTNRNMQLRSSGNLRSWVTHHQ